LGGNELLVGRGSQEIVGGKTMTSHAEKLEKVRKKLVVRPMEGRWRVKRKEQAAYARYKVVELLLQSEVPLTDTVICFKTNRSIESTKNDIRVLFDNKIVCNRVDCGDGYVYFTVCPSCPMKEKCEQQLEFWIKSGLMDSEPLPSEQFSEGLE